MSQRSPKKKRPQLPPQPGPRPPGAAAKPERPLRHDLVRAAALEVYAAVRSEGQLADRALDRVLRRETRLYSVERKAVAEAVWALLRTERRIDFNLFGRVRAELTPSQLFSLRYAALCVTRGEPPAAVAARQGLGPRGEALLSRAGAPLPGELGAVERIALEGSLPDELARRLIADLGEAEALQFVRAVGERAPLTIRANLLKTDRARLKQLLQEEGVQARETAYSPLGLTLESRINAFGLRAFREGLFEVQDEGSQLLALAAGAHPGEKVLDACAGAGGKTLALAGQMGNRGELWATDVDAGRLSELSRRARRAGVSNTRSRQIPADDSAAAALAGFERRFDRVLVDAPCTGLGALRRNPDARYRFKPDDFERHARRQLQVLSRFAALVRPGGSLVYATCSVAREENEAVAGQFLAGGAPFREAPLSEVLPASAAALADGPMLRLFPHRHGTDGFFAFRFVRQ